MTHYTRPELLLAALVVVIVLAAITKAIPRTPRVRAKALLTERARAVRDIIERILPHARVHVQVSMGALLQPKAGFSRKEAMRTRNRFSQKIVDFVIEDRAFGAILALVELDDRSDDAFRDRKRDAMTASAGYRTQARRSRDRPSQPRSDLQRPALAQPRRPLSALPHDPRRSRTS